MDELREDDHLYDSRDGEKWIGFIGWGWSVRVGEVEGTKAES